MGRVGYAVEEEDLAEEPGRFLLGFLMHIDGKERRGKERKRGSILRAKSEFNGDAAFHLPKYALDSGPVHCIA